VITFDVFPKLKDLPKHPQFKPCGVYDIVKSDRVSIQGRYSESFLQELAVGGDFLQDITLKFIGRRKVLDKGEAEEVMLDDVDILHQLEKLENEASLTLKGGLIRIKRLRDPCEISKKMHIQKMATCY